MANAHSPSFCVARPACPNAAALALTKQLAELDPFGRMHVRLRVLDALYGEGDTIAAGQAVQQLERNIETERVAQNAAATPVADLCVLSQWRLAGGDTVGVRSALAHLRAATANDPGKYLSVSPIVCAELIDAALAVKANPGSAVRQLQRLDSLALGSAVAGDANGYAHLLLARLYRQAGEPRLALDAIRRRSYMAGWPRYLATAWREEGMLAEALGDVDAALKAYEHFLALRGSPEPSAQPAVDDVRQRMAKLAAQRAPAEVVPTSTTNW
jgi:tetratricopeptide (TPR) repeat protein